MSWNKLPGCSVELTPQEFKQFTQTLDKIVSEQQTSSIFPAKPKTFAFSRNLNTPVGIVYFLSLPSEIPKIPNNGCDYVCTVSYNFHDAQVDDDEPQNILQKRFNCYLNIFSSQREVAEKGEKYVDNIWQGILGQTVKQAP